MFLAKISQRWLSSFGSGMYRSLQEPEQDYRHGSIKYLAPAVLVWTAILTVRPDLQQHAAGYCQRVVLFLGA
jgi:hypothetical protein